MIMKRRSSLRMPPGEKLFFALLLIVLLLGSLNIAKAKGYLIPAQPPLLVSGGEIRLDDLSLEQKIAQMVVVHGSIWNMKQWKDMQLGGIHLYALERPELFKETIDHFQEGMAVPFFVTVDVEGCINSLAEFYSSSAAKDITTEEEAFLKGSQDGAILSSLGFTVNFAPVVDLEDQIWRCRSFPGNEERIGELAEAYILGLQRNKVMATAKHFPGKTLAIRDPHKQLLFTTIEEADIFPYTYLASTDTLPAVMVSHQISSGEVDTEGFPAVVSPVAINRLRKEGATLIITDDTMMLGLRNFYDSTDEMYLAVFAAGNDLIINFNEDPNEIYHMIQVVKKAVEEGRISEEKIDASVQMILTAKGFTVV